MLPPVKPMVVDGVTYEVDWDSIPVGGSIFLPCVNIPALNKQMSARAKKFNWRMAFDIRIEAGKWGVRYWRTL
jgi:hypothetical protein